MATAQMTPLERETLAEQAVRSLKRYILTEGLKPGDQLPAERGLAESLGISRNVVREALRALVAEGYLSKEAGRGAFLRPFDAARLENELYEHLPDRDQVRQLREVRVALEVGAMSFVVRRINADEITRLRGLLAQMDEAFAAGRPLTPLDVEFHQTLLNAARNPSFVALRQSLFRSLRLMSLEAAGDVQSRSRDENTLRTASQIITALEHRDLEAAESAMRAHLIFDLPPGAARLFLFVDDGDIAEARGLRRTLHQASKHYGNPVLTPTHPWEGQLIQPSATVIYDPARKEYRLWYQGYRYLSSMEEQYSLCYAVSLDGIHWRKPALGLAAFDGEAQTNLLIPWGDPYRPDTTSATIFYDPQAEDAGRRYTMLHFCSGLHPMGLGLSYSPDGLHWTPHPENPVDAGGAEPMGEVVCALWEPLGRRAVAYYRVRLRVRPRRTLARAESQDLLHWNGHAVILEADADDPPGTELCGMTPFRYGDMFLAFVWVCRQKDNRIELQLASSRDGMRWQRVGDRQPFLPLGPADAFDETVIWRTTMPIVIGNDLRFYYAGSGRHTANPDTPAQGGIGLASVAMDRFASLAAGEEEGALLTRPIAIADQTRLLLNAVANPGGYVLAEVLDAQGQPIAGFRREESVAFSNPAIFHLLEWNDHCDLSALSGQTVQLRFFLRRAHLFAFRLSRPDADDADLVAGI